MERLLLLLVRAAVLDADARRKVKIGDRFLNAGDSGAEVRAFEAAGDGDHQLEVFAEDFVLRGSCSMWARAPRVAILPVELRKTVFSMASREARWESSRRTRTV